MKILTIPRPDKEGTFFPTRGFAWYLLFAAIIAGALVVRSHCLPHPPVNFHPTRQYRNSLIAQAIYTGRGLSSSRQLILEPPITEAMAAAVYTILGRESFVAARTMSIVWWMLAAVVLYLLAKRAISPDGAVLAVLFFLFVPFSVFCSRIFQRDPLMIMLFVAATWSIYRLRQTPSRHWLAAAIAFSAAAIFVKPVCIFIVLLTFLSTGVSRTAFRPRSKASRRGSTSR